MSSRDGLSAIAFTDGPAADQIVVCASDGRGLAWSAPVRVDGGAANVLRYTQADSVHVLGSRVYVGWSDERWGNREVYFNRSNDGGVTWAGEQRINTTLPAGFGTVRHWRMEVSPDPMGGQDHVYFLLCVTEPAGGADMEGLFLVHSNTAGAAFLAPTHAPAGFMPAGQHVENIDLAVQGGFNVNVLWQDDRGAPLWTVWYQVSFTGGATWLNVDRNMNSGAPGWAAGNVSLDVELQGVLAAWEDQRTGGAGGPTELQYAFSVDDGINWSPDFLVGGYMPGVDDVDGLDVALNGGHAIVAWRDNRLGAYENFVASGLLGALNPEAQLSFGGAQAPRLDGHMEGTGDDFAVAWRDTMVPSRIQSAFTRDGGQSWDPAFIVSDAALASSQPVLDYNASYNNFVHAWVANDAGVAHAFAGGYRPAQVQALGVFQAGQFVNFAVTGFPSSQAGWNYLVLLSAASGAVLLPDGRSTGLGLDPILMHVLAARPNFGGVLPASGNATTPVLVFPPAAVILPGTVLNFAAVAVNAPAGPAFGALTDLGSVVVQ
ncbi:MAG: hypothetical protein EYC70_09460 [Planctomycetota bacterium]|nr:MAG: hypothetical protein EYC70_09460 [Planctomycetota bacterium]